MGSSSSSNSNSDAAEQLSLEAKRELRRRRSQAIEAMGPLEVVLRDHQAVMQAYAQECKQYEHPRNGMGQFMFQRGAEHVERLAEYLHLQLRKGERVHRTAVLLPLLLACNDVSSSAPLRSALGASELFEPRVMQLVYDFVDNPLSACVVLARSAAVFMANVSLANLKLDQFGEKPFNSIRACPILKSLFVTFVRGPTWHRALNAFADEVDKLCLGYAKHSHPATWLRARQATYDFMRMAAASCVVYEDTDEARRLNSKMLVHAASVNCPTVCDRILSAHNQSPHPLLQPPCKSGTGEPTPLICLMAHGAVPYVFSGTKGLRHAESHAVGASLYLELCQRRFLVLHLFMRCAYGDPLHKDGTGTSALEQACMEDLRDETALLLLWAVELHGEYETLQACRELARKTTKGAVYYVGMAMKYGPEELEGIYMKQRANIHHANVDSIDETAIALREMRRTLRQRR